jgi:hypothetical protein
MPDAPEMSTCRHDACHATVARLLNIEVVHATASGDHPHVRTRFQNRDLEKIATVDLSGLATDGSSPETIALDERNAVARCEQSEASKSEQIAARLVEALQDAIETLQEISEAKGADDEDDFTRACNAVINMQRTAIDCLRRHGFEPRGTPVE